MIYIEYDEVGFTPYYIVIDRVDYYTFSQRDCSTQ